MGFYSYLVEHDYGLAPNPFGKYCTLAVCKPKIRRSPKLKIGDWIIGTGSKALEDVSGQRLRFHLIYAMQVSEIIPMEKYWNDPRFEYKKPILNGPLSIMYGDNIYYKNISGDWEQIDSAHSNDNGITNQKHLETDTGGKNALISELFFYFGCKAPAIPETMKDICHSGVGEKKLTDEKGNILINWIKSQFLPGIHGDPVNWIEYNQSLLF